MIDNTKQGSPALLKDNLKKLNGDWNRLKTKVAQRQHEFKQTQLELEQFHVLTERDYKQMGEIDRVVEKSYYVLEGTEAELEDALRVRKLYGLLTAWDAGMARCSERSPPTNVAWTPARCHMRVEFVVGSRLRPRIFLRVLLSSLTTKTNISKFHFDQDRGPA